MLPEKQIKFDFAENKKKFKLVSKSDNSEEHRIEQGKKLEIVAEEFWNEDVDTKYHIFKKVFSYKTNVKSENIEIKQVALDMLNEYSSDRIYKVEDCATVPRKVFYNLELLVLNCFSMLEEENKQDPKCGFKEFKQIEKKKWISGIEESQPTGDK